MTMSNQPKETTMTMIERSTDVLYSRGNSTMTKAERDEYLTRVKQAALQIDAETCEGDWCWADELDPYGIGEMEEHLPDPAARMWCDRHSCTRSRSSNLRPGGMGHPSRGVPMTAERTFTITFGPRSNVDGVKAVRRLLKYAGRYLGLRAIHAQEHNDAAAVATVPLPEGETTS